jgi:hypothetical protein
MPYSDKTQSTSVPMVATIAVTTPKTEPAADSPGSSGAAVGASEVEPAAGSPGSSGAAVGDSAGQGAAGNYFVDSVKDTIFTLELC